MLNNKTSRLVAVLLALGLCFGGVACENNSDSENEETKIKNVVLVIGDGMGLTHIQASEDRYDTNYPFTDWNNVRVNTSSVTADGKLTITDSAASATALATGTLTINGYVGKNPEGEDLSTIMDLAKQHGKATGVISTDAFTGATPAGFSGHSLSRANSEELFLSQMDSGLDLMCAASSESIQHKDKLAEKGYEFCRIYDEIEDSMTAEKVWWQFNMLGVDAPVQLEDVTPYALEFLDKDEDGFVLMLEQAYIDKYAHSNDLDGVVDSVRSLNNTVESILEWLGDRKDTAILITADHETGGLDALGNPQTGDSIYYKWSTSAHTDRKVGLFYYGFTYDFSTFTYYNDKTLIKNTNIYELMASFIVS